MVLGSREHGAEEKHLRELGRKVIFLSGSREQRPPPGRASKPFSCSAQLRLNFIILINVKLPTIVGILTFVRS